jgi:hypothetical protein
MVFPRSTERNFFPLRSTQHRCLKIVFFRVPVSLHYLWKYSPSITIFLSVQEVHVTGSCHQFFIICWAVSTRFAELHNETESLRELTLQNHCFIYFESHPNMTKIKVTSSRVVVNKYELWKSRYWIIKFNIGVALSLLVHLYIAFYFPISIRPAVYLL